MHYIGGMPHQLWSLPLFERRWPKILVYLRRCATTLPPNERWLPPVANYMIWTRRALVD